MRETGTQDRKVSLAIISRRKVGQLGCVKFVPRPPSKGLGSAVLLGCEELSMPVVVPEVAAAAPLMLESLLSSLGAAMEGEVLLLAAARLKSRGSGIGAGAGSKMMWARRARWRLM